MTWYGTESDGRGGLRDLRLLCVATCVLLALPLVAAAQEDLDAGEDLQPQGEVRIQPLEKGTFNFYVRDTELALVLRQLNTQVQKNIVISPRAQGVVTVDLYGVTFDQALEAVLHSAGMVAVEKQDMIFIYTPQEYATILKAEKTISIRVFHLEYLTAADAMELIKDQVSADGKVSFTPAAQKGITTTTSGVATVNTGGNEYANREVLVVRDYVENLDVIAGVLEELDIRPQQILIESTIMRATLTEDTVMGVDLQYYHGLSNAGTSPSVNPSDGADNSTWRTTNFKNAQSLVGTNFAAALPATATQTGSFTFGIISDNVAAFLKAVEGVTDLTIIANPKLLVLNKQQGSVLVGEKIGYRDTTTQTETSATTSVNFLETGTNLVVRPYISKDGYIRMELQPKDSTGELNAVGTDVLPRERTTQVTTNMLVRDGQTIIIGGLFRERTNLDRSQMPVVGNIPILGMGARNQQDVAEREEVIILITPHIIAHPPDEELSEEMKDRVEAVRLASRKGLACWASTRLVGEFIQSARRDMAQGNPGKALWNANCALSIRPNDRDAMYIKDLLSPQASWAREPAALTTHNIVERMIHEDTAGASPATGTGPVRDRRLLDYDRRREPTEAGRTGDASAPLGKPELPLAPEAQPAREDASPTPADPSRLEPDTSSPPRVDRVPEVLSTLLEEEQSRQATLLNED